MQRTMLALGLIVLAAACASTMAGPGGTSARYGWVRGELSAAVGAPLPETELATRRACGELGLVGIVAGHGERSARIDARMGTGTKVRVDLLALGDDRTLVTIRVGHIGDRAVSMQLLRHISEGLQGGSGSSPRSGSERADGHTPVPGPVFH